MAELHKKDLEHLAKLARIELDPAEEDKLLADLGSILAHFEELKGLSSPDLAPMTGGTDMKNVFRGDAEREGTNQGAGKESFPASAKGLLKIPPVFE